MGKKDKEKKEWEIEQLWFEQGVFDDEKKVEWRKTPRGKKLRAEQYKRWYKKNKVHMKEYRKKRWLRLIAQEKAKMIESIQKRLPKKNKIVPEWETERSVYISKSKNATIDEVIKLLKEYEQY